MERSPLVLILVHGLFGWGENRDQTRWPKDYWYGARAFLEKEYGARSDVVLSIIAPSLPTVESVEVRGAALQSVIETTLQRPPPGTRAHLIAHSHGGVDSRWVIAQPGTAEKVASLTTIGTAHRGTTLMSWAYNCLPIFRFGGKLLLAIGEWKRRRGGIDHHEFYHHFLQGYESTREQMARALYTLTLRGAAKFNEQLAGAEHSIRTNQVQPVAYYAYGGRVKKPRTLFLKITHLLIRWFGTPLERESGDDGTCSVWSTHYPWEESDHDFDHGPSYVRTIPHDHYHQMNWMIPDLRKDESLPLELQAIFREAMERILALHQSHHL